MASFRQHVTVSTTMGVVYGTAACMACGIDWAVCAIAGGLTALAGMLPDLDSPRAQPVREVFGLTAALVPLLFLDPLTDLYISLYRVVTGEEAILTHPMLVLLVAGCYFCTRFGGAWVLDRLTVHRGMLHSIPAALIVAATAFLLMDLPDVRLRLLLAGGPLLGFVSHLVMDELWSVKWFGLDMGFKKSSGTALKLYSNSVLASATTYAILLGLCYLVLRESEIKNVIVQIQGASQPTHVVRELVDTVVR